MVASSACNTRSLIIAFLHHQQSLRCAIASAGPRGPKQESGPPPRRTHPRLGCVPSGVCGSPPPAWGLSPVWGDLPRYGGSEIGERQEEVSTCRAQSAE